MRETAATALEFARLAVENPITCAARSEHQRLRCRPVGRCGGELHTDQRADLVGEVIARAKKEDVKAGGSLSTMGVEHASRTRAAHARITEHLQPLCGGYE